MVKIENFFGDIKKGKQDNAIYQLSHGQQIRRSAYTEKKEPSHRQVNQRNLFKKAVKWVNSLSSEEKTAIKEYYKNSFLAWTPGQPSTWYNFAKTLVMKKPEFQVISEFSGEYIIKHPGISSIKELTSSDEVLYIDENLTDLLLSDYTNFIRKIPNVNSSILNVTTISGEIYTYQLPTIGSSMVFFDPLYFDSRYFK